MCFLLHYRKRGEISARRVLQLDSSSIGESDLFVDRAVRYESNRMDKLKGGSGKLRRRSNLPMIISSRTPEGDRNVCPVCGHQLRIEPSADTRDAPCPNCGCLLWFPVDNPSSKTPLTLHERQGILEFSDAAPTVSTAVRIARHQEKFLLGLCNATATQKFEEGLKNELNFGDACRFWGITENLHGGALKSRLDRMQGLLLEAERLVSAGNVELSNGRSISREDVSLLTAVNEYLEDKFSRHLTLLRNRAAKS